MTEQETTLYVAIAAVFGSFITLIGTSIAAKSAERRLASRQALLSDLSFIGRCIHETIALTHTMTKATDVTRKDKIQAARGAADRLKSKRIDVRYSLWGLEKGLRTLTRFPDWVAHMKDHPDTTAEFLKLGSSLGTQLDIAIRDAFIFGNPPTKWRRFRVSIAILLLKRKRSKFLKRPRQPTPPPKLSG